MKQITKSALQVSIGCMIGTIVYGLSNGHWLVAGITNIEIQAGIWMMYYVAPKGEE